MIPGMMYLCGNISRPIFRRPNVHTFLMIMNAHAAQRRATKEFRGEKAENPSFGRP
jgi:hypothetical protein